MIEKKPRVIHAVRPNGAAHPFKAWTMCQRWVRFGGIEIKPEAARLAGDVARPVTCLQCKDALKRQGESK